jgi:hypothetical protein
MKLGVAYNVFDGEELLIASVKRIRPVAQRVVICFSETSHAGEFNPDLRAVLNRLKPLVDELIQFAPSLEAHRFQNETAQRNAGLLACRGCDAFMTMDCDEFYDRRQIAAAFGGFAASGADSSACRMQTYYKYADVRLVPAEDYCVPLFYRIDERRFEYGIRWPVRVDATRRMEPRRLMVFDRPAIEMHHMSHVRRDFRRKLRNSSSETRADRIEQFAGAHDRWVEGDPIVLPNSGPLVYSTERVPLLFPELASFRSPKPGP